MLHSCVTMGNTTVRNSCEKCEPSHPRHPFAQELHLSECMCPQSLLGLSCGVHCSGQSLLCTSMLVTWPWVSPITMNLPSNLESLLKPAATRPALLTVFGDWRTGPRSVRLCQWHRWVWFPVPSTASSSWCSLTVALGVMGTLLVLSRKGQRES